MVVTQRSRHQRETQYHAHAQQYHAILAGPCQGQMCRKIFSTRIPVLCECAFFRLPACFLYTERDERRRGHVSSSAHHVSSTRNRLVTEATLISNETVLRTFLECVSYPCRTAVAGMTAVKAHDYTQRYGKPCTPVLELSM